MKKLSLIVLICTICVGAFAQKKVLTHKDYDHWKSMRYNQISKDGNLITYEINPQRGDGNLFIVNSKSGKTEKINRARRAYISSHADYVAFTIKPHYDTIRKKKLAKVKKSKMPKDTLGVWIVKDSKLLKFGNLKKLKVPADASSWFAYTYTKKKEKKKKPVKDSLAADKKAVKDTVAKVEKKAKKAKKKKKSVKLKGDNLVIFNPILDKKFEYEHVTDFTISRNGSNVLFTQETGDTLKINNILSFDIQSEKLVTLSSGKHHNFKKLALSRKGDRLAFLQSTDSLKIHTYNLMFKESAKAKTRILVDTLTKDIYKDWTASKNGYVYFSENGERLFFGIAPKPEQKKKDTLTKDEKYHLDVWNWKDTYLQPRQKLKAKKELTRTYETVYNIKKKDFVQIETTEIKDSRTFDHGNSVYALTYNNEPYGRLIDSDDSYYDVYLKNTYTGKQELVLSKFGSSIELSPAQKYIAYFQPKDSSWYSYNVKTKKIVALTKAIPVKFFNEQMDMPMAVGSYGSISWTKNDKYVLINDKFDVWKIDPSGKKKAINLTNGFGRKNNIQFRRIQLDSKHDYITENELMLTAFNDKNKKAGYFSVNVKGGTPKQLLFTDAAFSYRAFEKAENADKILWTKGTFTQYPELHVSDLSFNNIKKLSNTNPQQKDYNWGTVELVNWTSGDGDELQGLMYKPENYDPNKKYPMLVYFYERSSNGLHSHHVPQPNWSIINRSYCVSNGYMIFVPDITYKNKVGFPGEAAYSAIVTGTLAMLDKYKSIDKDNLALQGQSWGGYQIAYLVTRTNLYKCAMAGAPVSNMTSAYGGIRWASGMSRQFQYEHTQSRLGGTLWNSTIEYIENSPVFYAPKIKTPLLIMHNDNDGAVPWYQGIELFMAMRRLNKPCWMLTYNGESHNLRRRANRKDLSIRTMQFFDYYLKGDNEPVWMNSGVPAYKKNTMTGYDLVK